MLNTTNETNETNENETKSTIRNILCLGDSLTAGYFIDKNSRVKFHPYSVNLNKLANIPCTTEGFSGYTTKNLIDKMYADYKLKKPLKYDRVIFLAGTNDLSSESSQTIFNNLKHLLLLIQKFLLTENGQIIFMTIPEMGAELNYPQIKVTRCQVNKYLIDHVKNHNQNQNQNHQITIFDLATSIPCYSTTAGFVQFWSSDKLHFSPAGYNKIGQLLYENAFIF